MEPIALVLAVLAAVLAVPVPILLHEARFRLRSPWAAMLLWQAIALAGGLSIVGAPIVYGLSPFGSSLPEALLTAARLTLMEDYAALAELEVHPWHLFALCLGVLLGGHLLLTLARTYLRVLTARRRHRQLVELLSTPLQGRQAEQAAGISAAQIIEHEAPLAYCLPGRTSARSVTVLSRGLLEQLEPAELAAVVAHERTHLVQRHHLLTMAFEAWYRALPWLPTTRYGREAVLELTEMLADDGALAQHSREDLLRSLAVSSGSAEQESPRPGSDAEGNSLITGARLRRLLVPPAPLSLAARAAVLLVSAVLLGAPTVLLLTS
ncbi:M56 family metallopeptidase [Nesterenkonia sp.]|uniref:M56 family metallopeptidase n=1 Tax=Nesterenkonia sp. TaxID=704201 RepID=UPI0026360EEB|nr:M56 family metallopeptidase [Nesterenkonia sp.]